MRTVKVIPHLRTRRTLHVNEARACKRRWEGEFEAEGVPARVVSTSASHRHSQHARTTSPPGHDSRLTTRHARMPAGQRGGAGVERKLVESEIGRSHLSLVLVFFFSSLFSAGRFNTLQSCEILSLRKDSGLTG